VCVLERVRDREGKCNGAGGSEAGEEIVRPAGGRWKWEVGSGLCGVWRVLRGSGREYVYVCAIWCVTMGGSVMVVATAVRLVD
jgi:hypothetical protein